ncbi:uncharacterized protein Z520_07635 [Fonsecaea multimorphosa CBS 102226]|uniref:DUF7702 domain-containing protein n=1 Tax=Fonsecaea multimorphosa CBS 102226 TaxID=1442371 RepID=A0A0D2H539_9EURO|nr:uncharacterized protein Z520_07635 [Fonsecaea multimorphosa CBS 102226]KIX96915.1 hypothetical protein Z520_07635 [Fonsecaea multimorphosa CBS 102226]OAL22590.1 hypothetical protein AYO22_07148 [Fonsecaea multimorphosa]
MHIDSRGWLSVAEIVIFSPCILVSFILCSRHGFGRSSGWFYTLLLCVVRVVGAGCQLYTYHEHSAGLLKTTIILDTVGLSPLLLAALGLLSRLVDSINRSGRGLLGVRHFRLLQTVIGVAMILSIIGGVSAKSDGASIKPPTMSKVGALLFIPGFIGILFFCARACTNTSYAETGERRLGLAVAIALPFILVRLAYTELTTFLHNKDFNSVDGKLLFTVILSVLPELVVVLNFLVVGFTIPILGADLQGPILGRGRKESNRRGATAEEQHSLYQYQYLAHAENPNPSGRY